jgi:hypothetical protein
LKRGFHSESDFVFSYFRVFVIRLEMSDSSLSVLTTVRPRKESFSLAAEDAHRFADGDVGLFPGVGVFELFAFGLEAVEVGLAEFAFDG